MALVLACMVLSSTTVSAKRILFYEVGTSDQYQIEKGYSKFKQELQARGNDVASITQAGSLTKEKLEGYDVLVIQDLRRQLEIEDISAILWFVMQKGSGLFINGGDPNAANKITIPFGTTMDAATLKDITSPIPNDPDAFDFMVTQFPPEDEYRVLRQGVNKIGFYKGNGLMLSGNARCVATGDADTFSDTGSFAAGSKPCVASGALFGNGLVFVLSDPDLLTDKNINSFDNRVMGLNVIDWVSMTRELPSPGNTTQDISMIISSLNLENKRLSAQVEQLTKEKSFLEGSVGQLTSDLGDLNDRILQMEGERIGPLTKTNWVLLILGFCVLGGAFLLSKRREKAAVDAGEMSYELGEELGDLTDVGGEQKPK